MNTIPGPCETLVSSVHGNAGFSDAASPVTIRHHSQGAILSPPSTAATSNNLSRNPESKRMEPATVMLGKVHYALPTLRTPDEETPLGSLIDGIATITLDIRMALQDSAWRRDENESARDDGDISESEILTLPTERLATKITAADIHAGRELLWSSNRLPDGQQSGLPANQDIQLHVVSVIWPDFKKRFNENVQGLCVTLTVEFCGESPKLMVSSVALVQELQRLKRR